MAAGYEAICYVANIGPISLIASYGWLSRHRIAVQPHNNAIVLDNGSIIPGVEHIYHIKTKPPTSVAKAPAKTRTGNEPCGPSSV